MLGEFYGATVPDMMPPELRLLFVGINPSLMAAKTGVHFARRGNRFWPALHAAGITEHEIAPYEGLSPEDSAELDERGVGITNIVPLATARADELTPEQITAGMARLRTLVDARRPGVVVILGVTAWRLGTGDRKAAMGWQDSPFGDTRVYVAANPSGLNAHYQIPDLARQYAEAAEAAGLELYGGSL